MKKPFAVQVRGPEALPLLEMVYPPIKDLDYVTQVHNHVIVFNFQEEGNTRIMKQDVFKAIYTKSEYGSLAIRTNLQF